MLTRIIDPITRLSVPRKSKKGKKILTHFKELTENCDHMKQWRLGQKLGEGGFGAAFVICDESKNCEYVLKIQENNSEFKTEVRALFELNNWPYSPRIFAAWICKGLGYIIMDRLYQCSKPPACSTILNMLESLKGRGWLHVDTHSGNILCTSTGKPILFDFGLAVKISSSSITQHSYIKEDKLTFSTKQAIEYLDLWQKIEALASCNPRNPLRIRFKQRMNQLIQQQEETSVEKK